MSSDILTMHAPKFQATLDHLKDELKTLRTGQASPALVEDLAVEAYGAKTPLIGLASITCPDRRTIAIEPWDKSLVKGIEKAIQEAKLGLNPAVAGSVIRLNMPPMTEQSRKELIKVMNDKLEHTRIRIRNVRDEAKADVLEAEKENMIAEDERYKLLEQLDKMVGDWNEKVKKMGEEKEKEIMTI